MVPGVSVLKNLPMPAKIGGAAFAGGAVFVGMLSLIPPRARLILFIILFIGLALVALLLFLYRRLLKWLRDRKAAPMESGIIQNTAAMPQGVGEAASLARLDDMRKKFEEGIKLSRFCSKKLDESEKKVSLLLQDDAGGVHETPFLSENAARKTDEEPVQ